MEGEDGFRRIVLGYKMQERSFLEGSWLKLGERENRRGGEGVLVREKMEGWKLEVKRMRMKLIKFLLFLFLLLLP